MSSIGRVISKHRINAALAVVTFAFASLLMACDILLLVAVLSHGMDKGMQEQRAASP